MPLLFVVNVHYVVLLQMHFSDWFHELCVVSYGFVQLALVVERVAIRSVLVVERVVNPILFFQVWSACSFYTITIQ